MTQDDWPTRYTRTVAKEIKRYRNARGISAQELADECTRRGVPIHRSVIANLESGRRPLVNVTELLAIAASLAVPPLQLLVPLGVADVIEMIPGEDPVHPWTAAKWLTGESTFPGDGAPIELFRQHDQLVHTIRMFLDGALGQVAEDQQLPVKFKDLAATQFRTLVQLRDIMTQRGITPPPLPAEIEAAQAELMSIPQASTEAMARSTLDAVQSLLADDVSDDSR